MTTFDKEDWTRRLNQASKSEEFLSLLKELHVPLPPLDPALTEWDKKIVGIFFEHPERHSDLVRWCREYKEYDDAVKAGPKTVAEVEALDALMDRLRDEAESCNPSPD